MSRRDFELLAAVVREAPLTRSDRITMASRIGAVCALNNPRFDWRRWRVACGVTF